MKLIVICSQIDFQREKHEKEKNMKWRSIMQIWDCKCVCINVCLWTILYLATIWRLCRNSVLNLSVKKTAAAKTNPSQARQRGETWSKQEIKKNKRSDKWDAQENSQEKPLQGNSSIPNYIHIYKYVLANQARCKETKKQHIITVFTLVFLSSRVQWLSHWSSILPTYTNESSGGPISNSTTKRNSGSKYTKKSAQTGKTTTTFAFPAPQNAHI